jgi:hypothetical protein
MQNDNEERIRINNYLNLQEKNLKGENIFRLTWANNEFEMREGTYNEFKGDLFVRTVYGVKRTPKYPHLKDLWILEQFFGAERTQTDTVKDHNGYECIYSFRNSRTFEPLPLRLRVVELVLKSIKKRRNSYMLSKSLLQQEEDAKEKRMDDYTRDSINDYSLVESNLRSGEAISLAGLDILGDIKRAENKTDNANITSKSGQ